LKEQKMTTLHSMQEQCDSRGEELELGQIGECDECQAEREDYQVIGGLPIREAGRKPG
jgi:hypothetical protein